MKKFWSLMLCIGLCVSAFVTPTTVHAQEKSNDVVVLYTNDVHCQVDRAEESFGYEKVAAYKKEMQEAYQYVTLVDCGDAIQGGPIGTLSKGSYLVDIMNATGYDLAIPGNHEFDYGMEQFLDAIVPDADFSYLSCNFKEKSGDVIGDTVLEPYYIATYGETKIAFLGVTTPESFSKSTPKYFQDDKGNYIYTFCEGKNGQELYEEVQKNIAEVKEEGVDYVVALTHLGVDEQSSPWMSTELISNTTGLDVVLDGHSHSVIEGQKVADKEGNEVLLSSTGTKLANIGKLVITEDGSITTELISEYEKSDDTVAAYIAGINNEFEELLSEVIASSEVNLCINDPATGTRLIRSQETNLGDLCADAYRFTSGSDVAFVNGGGIRVDINAGEITYNDVILVHPFGNALCVVEATGQEIKDALEMGSRFVGESENGGFLQVSGLKYTIDTSIPSSVVVDDKGSFVKVDGTYRVTDVQILNKAGDYESLDPDKTYQLASHDYMLKNGGDGISMFADNKLLQDSVMLDNQVLITYVQDYLNGEIGDQYGNVAGEGRITIVDGSQEELPKTGTVPVIYLTISGMVFFMAGVVVHGKNKKRTNQA